MTNPDQPSAPPTLPLVEKLYAIFLTLSSTLHKRLIKANPKIAKDVWDTIEAIFQDNKRTRVVALKGELRMIQMGDQTADEYFSNIDSIITLLNDLGSDVSQDDVVTYAINGLSDKYGSLSLIIAHKEPFLDLSTMRSMVSTDEMRIQNKSPSLSVSTNSSAPQVLLTETPHRVQDTRTNKERDNRNNNKTEVCRNFGQGVCRWGATCRGLDLAAQQQLLSLLQAQNTLLAQYGLSTISIPPGMVFGSTWRGSDIAYLLLYIDDIILSASSIAFLQSIIATLHAEFSMTDLGQLNYFLGISVTRNTSGMFLSQQKYASELFKCAGMLTYNPCRTLIDTYSKLSSDGDLVRVVSTGMILESLISLLSRGSCDWAGCPTTRQSTSGYCVFLGNNLLSWSLKRQVTLSRSNVEAEYRGVANAVAKTCYAVYLSSNPMQHQRTKHIEIDIHFVRDLVAAGHIRVLHVPSRYQLDFGESSKKSQRVREGSQNSSAGTFPASDTYSPSITKSVPDKAKSKDHSHSSGRPHRRDSSPSRDHPRSRDRLCGIKETYGNTCSSYRTWARHRYHSGDRDRSRSMKRGRESKSKLSRMPKSSTSDGGHWKSKLKRRKPTDKEDLSVPWSCKEVDLFTPRIRNFKSSQKTRMPNNVKTYDRTGDLEDHVKTFQATAQVKRWAMPTWCHMFNSTLIGTARVWFDELPSKSIDGYKDLKAAFLANFMQQKKYVKDPVEIYNIKQRDGETIKDFMKRFKVETRRMKGAPKCMRISGFMHRVNKPELIKRLNEHVPKTMEEMMTATTAFIRG
ncbi:reverse transcriptase domain-containing protein [Tanacetum coccineum]|uniref:Reverse transcriptase domain-containing protein n=1 Tax=Tanacetum coccineum TaxID=301880 RepID=A0ABQ5GGG3_9ASTR